MRWDSPQQGPSHRAFPFFFSFSSSSFFLCCPSNRADSRLQTEAGRTALFYASSKKRVDVARLLLERGADPNFMDERNETPLFRAVVDCGEDPTMCQVLLEEGAKVNVHNREGNTPLHLSVDEGLLAVTRHLLEEGARMMKNNGDQTPLDVARRPEVRQILLDWRQEKQQASSSSS